MQENTAECYDVAMLMQNMSLKGVQYVRDLCDRVKGG